jgi:DNA topoisomerase I
VTARRRVLTAAFLEVSEALGNTPAVCRTSYVDPRVVDRFHDGVTIEPVTGRRPRGRSLQAAVERAVLDLLRGSGDPGAP